MSLDVMAILARYIAAKQWVEGGREAVVLDRLKNVGAGLLALFGEWKIGFEQQDEMMRVCLGFSDRAILPSLPPLLPDRPSALKEFLRSRAILLYKTTDGCYVAGTTDPLVADYVGQLSLLLGQPVDLVYLSSQEMDEGRALLGEDVLRQAAPSTTEQTKSPEEYDIEDAKSPVVQLVDLTIQEAIRRKVSDIHVEPFERTGAVRYRIDGVLVKAREYGIELHAAVSSRIKLMAGMDIAEKRVPQDGRIEYRSQGVDLDLRVASTPTNFGETVVLRLLSRAAVKVNLDKGGFRPDVLAAFRKSMSAANGIILVTGPTGSGKTTTLYGMVNELNDVETKIFTIEDPIEYVMEGIVQIPVKVKVGMTFAAALRAAMRSDPDIIMIGEIRDEETAGIAVQASLTGHLVLATLHTNSAPATLPRLIDMGIAPYLLSATMEAVLAQRLVRRVCHACREPAEVTKSVRELFAQQKVELTGPIYEGKGCESCLKTGYSGRMGVHEFMLVSEGIRQAVNQNAPETRIKEIAVGEGMRTLLQDGLIKIAGGESTLREVLRVIGGSV